MGNMEGVREDKINILWLGAERTAEEESGLANAKLEFQAGLDKLSIADACEFLAHLEFSEQVRDYISSLYKREPDCSGEAMLKTLFLRNF